MCLSGCRAGSILGIDPQAVDQPVCVLEGGWVVLDIILAGGCLWCTTGIGRPDTAGPVAAEGDIHDHLLILEFGVDVARPGEFRGGQSPVGWVGIAARDVGRNGASGEEPYGDMVTGPLGSKDSSSIVVEPLAEAAGVLAVNGTADVGSLAGSGDITVVGRECAGEVASVADRAARVGVQCHAVG